MKVFGIIAEYNPFHNGHRFQLDALRAEGATHIAVVMSGHFVQRGDVSICSKWARAEAALQNGADLVVELPTAFAMSPARDFARGGVFLLSQLGVDEISFGSECGDLAFLTDLTLQLADLEENPLYRTQWQEYLKAGYSYPKTRELLVQKYCGANTAAELTKPNNLLGLEYLQAARELNSPVSFSTIKRQGVSHDEDKTSGTFASASHIRSLLYRGESEAFRYLPPAMQKLYRREQTQGKAPCSLTQLERVCLSKLRFLSKDELRVIRGIQNGLENRLLEKLKDASSLYELETEMVNRQYSRARIRRILLNAFLENTVNREPFLPQYIRILGLNQRGAEILKRAKPALPIESKMIKLAEAGYADAQLEIRATDQFSLASPQIQPCGREFTQPMIFQKTE